MKHLFKSFLSDDFKDIYFCESYKDKTMIIEENYNFREAYPDCKAEVVSQKNCSSGYALATTSMIADRLCQASGDKKRQYKISAQHILSCDRDFNEGCRRGYVQRAIDFLLHNKLKEENCSTYAGVETNCSTNVCPATMPESNRLSKVCGLESHEAIKREIKKNGPVLAGIRVMSDFLTYKSGIFYPDTSLYEYEGKQIVKVIGWGVDEGKRPYWIIENSWGPDWGENGLAKIGVLGGDDLGISMLILTVDLEGQKEPSKVVGKDKGKKGEAKKDEGEAKKE